MENSRKKLYPIFLQCSEYTLEPYWKQIFEDCYKGKFPKGCSINNQRNIFYIKNNTDNSRNNKNYITYYLNKTPEETFKELKKLFQENLNLKSFQDKKDLQDEIDDICQDIQKTYNGNWQSIKRKKLKEYIIRKFILHLKEVYMLNDKETTQVSQLIKLGFLFNWINNKYVIYENQNITDIKTLHFDNEERTFFFNEISAQSKREYKPKINKLSFLWQKHNDIINSRN
jgi:hypothetical protein